METAFTIRRASIVMEWMEAAPIRPPLNIFAPLCNVLVRLACLILQLIDSLRTLRAYEKNDGQSISMRAAWRSAGERAARVRFLVLFTEAGGPLMFRQIEAKRVLVFVPGRQ